MKYYVATSKNQIKHLNSKQINNVNVKEDILTFETNTKSLNKLLEDINNISYYNKRKIRILIFIKKYIVSIISIIILLFFIVNEQFVIKKIKFINENTYSNDVIEYIYKNSLEKKILYYYLNDDLNNINKDLKKHFYYYEWINVNKRGNVLQVYIDKQDEKSYLDTTSNVKGDIIASRDGIIRYYFIKKGVNIIKDNQSVKKGEVLVSGNLLIKNEKVKYIHPLGLVLAEVVDYEITKVKKVNNEYVRTGKIEIKDIYQFMNYNRKIKIDFTMYEEENELLFDYKIIKKTKNIYYEIKEIINYYDKESAKKYAYSKLEKEFNDVKIHDKEKIVEIILLSEYEDNEYYYFKYLVKKIINISEFKAVNLEEK